ncbi:DUF5000 domain-containing lipoprotein [Niabella beijingensis]|uniref:DUF5000 domain-containing lipoprotein n=1 Tax=Niabella beijingensis TaxID=2872700 RepID=UPI001CBD75BA|nr:DUF5000 domain-containing lipoprotein [Niabella beijingensis]MBZ4192244.1 DUF4959 domain-containing protein [Niabella beijingensis]
MKNRIFCNLLLLLLLMAACKKDVSGPAVKDGTAPGPVRNVTVENLPGAARIGYALPADPDLQYVKARYTTRQGITRETKVSRYNRSLLVEGFGDTSQYQVSLYAVDKSENVSPALDVTVRPLTPPVWTVRKSLLLAPDFGGVNVKYTNPGESDLAIVVLANDSLGQFSPRITNYTNLKAGDFSTRNMPDVPTKFGVYIRDRWGNLSDTLITELTPLFEELLDRRKMKGVALPTDAPLGHGGDIAGLFDGNPTGGGFYHSGDAAHMPQWFTYDMGVTAKLSRLVWFMRPGFYYTLHNPREVEIWGSNNPNPDGSFDDSWMLLTKSTQIKPSGLPEGQLSQADMDAALAGHTVVFPLNTPKVRYIRFKTLKNWSNGTYVNFYQIMMWGDTK